MKSFKSRHSVQKLGPKSVGPNLCEYQPHEISFLSGHSKLVSFLFLSAHGNRAEEKAPFLDLCFWDPEFTKPAFCSVVLPNFLWFLYIINVQHSLSILLLDEKRQTKPPLEKTTQSVSMHWLTFKFTWNNRKIGQHIRNSTPKRTIIFINSFVMFVQNVNFN